MHCKNKTQDPKFLSALAKELSWCPMAPGHYINQLREAIINTHKIKRKILQFNNNTGYPKSMSALAKKIAYYLTAPGHYLNHCREATNNIHKNTIIHICRLSRQKVIIVVGQHCLSERLAASGPFY